MPDLARFSAFAKGIGLVPPVPPTNLHGGTGGGTEIRKQIQHDRNRVPPVPPVPPQNIDVANEGSVSRTHDERDFSVHIEAFDLHCNFEERAAIREYSGGFPRHEAEALAWKEVYGERAEVM